MIITIISPIKNKEEYEKLYVELSLLGHVVLLPVDARGKGDVIVHEQLMSVHRKKLRMADLVVVCTVDGYMGQDTLAEIAYAQYILGKPIRQHDIVKTEDKGRD